MPAKVSATCRRVGRRCCYLVHMLNWILREQLNRLNGTLHPAHTHYSSVHEQVHKIDPGRVYGAVFGHGRGSYGRSVQLVRHKSHKSHCLTYFLILVGPAGDWNLKFIRAEKRKWWAAIGVGHCKQKRRKFAKTLLPCGSHRYAWSHDVQPNKFPPREKIKVCSDR